MEAHGAGAYRLSNLNSKAGLEHIDRSHVAQVIYEASKVRHVVPVPVWSALPP